MKINDWTISFENGILHATNSYGEKAVQVENDYFFLDGTWYCRADLIRWWKMSQIENFDSRTFF